MLLQSVFFAFHSTSLCFPSVNDDATHLSTIGLMLTVCCKIVIFIIIIFITSFEFYKGHVLITPGPHGTAYNHAKKP